MHENLVFGPGDLLGQPLELDAEQQAFIWRFYELFPKGHEREGRRRFQRCTLSLAKGLRKTELAACIAAAEVHPDAPVRFNGWKGKGLAKGRGVTDPHVILVAFTEEQSNDTTYGALRAILEKSPIADEFDIGVDRIIHKRGGGKVVSLSGSPSARDGARTTFLLCDETHWWVLPRLKAAYQTMMNNLPKRMIADAWALETTTAPEPGAGSVAESTMDYARSVAEGRVEDSSLFFFHRQASDHHDLATRDGARAAVIEASGAAAGWRNIDHVVGRWADPTTDRAFWERTWCNRLVQGATQAFDVEMWKSLVKPGYLPRPGALIVIGFDGARKHDATGIVAGEVETGFLWRVASWECPQGRAQWEVPAREVDNAIARLFNDYTVWRLYADPRFWTSEIAAWKGRYDTVNGEEKPLAERRVHAWETNRPRQMAHAVEGFDTAIRTSLILHDGDKDLQRHIGNSRKRTVGRDETGQSLWVIEKERDDSPLKIDLGVAAVLAWLARTHAIAAGAMKTTSVYAQRGVLVVT